MMGQTTVMEKSAKCTSAVSQEYTIAKFGADDDTIDVASSATDKFIGILQHTTSAAGEVVRLMMLGISRIKLGGTVTRGDEVTSDASSKGIKAVAGQSSIGIVMASGVSGDIVPIFVRPSNALSPE